MTRHRCFFLPYQPGHAITCLGRMPSSRFRKCKKPTSRFQNGACDLARCFLIYLAPWKIGSESIALQRPYILAAYGPVDTW